MILEILRVLFWKKVTILFYNDLKEAFWPKQFSNIVQDMEKKRFEDFIELMTSFHESGIYWFQFFLHKMQGMR